MIPTDLGTLLGPQFQTILSEAAQNHPLTKNTIGSNLLDVHMELCNQAAMGAFAKFQLSTMIHHIKKDIPCMEGCLISSEHDDVSVLIGATKCLEYMRNWLPFYSQEVQHTSKRLQGIALFKMKYSVSIKEDARELLDVQYDKVSQLKQAVLTLTQDLSAVVNELNQLVNEAQFCLSPNNQENPNSEGTPMQLKTDSLGDFTIVPLSATREPSKPPTVQETLEEVRDLLRGADVSVPLKKLVVKLPAKIRREIYKKVASSQGQMSPINPNKGNAAWGKLHFFKPVFAEQVLFAIDQFMHPLSREN